MIRTVLFALSVAAAASAAGQSATTTAPEAPKGDSPLVKAAKANGGAKKPMPKKPITNADVRKSGGKLIETPGVAAASTAPASQTPQPGMIALHEAQKKALAAAQKRVAAAETRVGEAEKEVARVEQSYYEASDLNYRDNVIPPRFAQAKKQLDEARKELADARDELTALGPKPTTP